MHLNRQCVCVCVLFASYIVKQKQSLKSSMYLEVIRKFFICVIGAAVAKMMTKMNAHSNKKKTHTHSFYNMPKLGVCANITPIVCIQSFVCVCTQKVIEKEYPRLYAHARAPRTLTRKNNKSSGAALMLAYSLICAVCYDIAPFIIILLLQNA